MIESSPCLLLFPVYFLMLTQKTESKFQILRFRLLTSQRYYQYFLLWKVCNNLKLNLCTCYFSLWKEDFVKIDFCLSALFIQDTFILLAELKRSLTLLHGCFSRFLNCTIATKSRDASQICKHYQNIADTLVFTMVLGIHCNFFSVYLFEWKFAHLMFSSFLKDKMCAAEILDAPQRYCGPERARAASDPQFVQAWLSNLYILFSCCQGGWQIATVPHFHKSYSESLSAKTGKWSKTCSKLSIKTPGGHKYVNVFTLFLTLKQLNALLYHKLWAKRHARLFQMFVRQIKVKKYWNFDKATTFKTSNFE